MKTKTIAALGVWVQVTVCIFSARSALAQAQVEQVASHDEVPYGSKGVVEVGGSGSFEFASEFTHVSLRPFAGWFVVDYLQLSGIVEVAWSQVRVPSPADGTMWRPRTLFGVYAEPSLHVPLSPGAFGFLGVGLGPTYDSQDYGLSVRPRVGCDLQIGRSAIFRPAFEVTYSTVDVISRREQSVDGANIMFGVSLGFSATL